MKMNSTANGNVKRTTMSNLSGRRITKIAAALITAGLVTGMATPAFASSVPGTSVSFTVSPAPVTVAGGPGIVVTNVWSHGVLTVSAD
jgi:hypothetical protein